MLTYTYSEIVIKSSKNEAKETLVRIKLMVKGEFQNKKDRYKN